MYLLFRSAISGRNINYPINFMGLIARIIIILHRSFHFFEIFIYRTPSCPEHLKIRIQNKLVKKNL